jgi:hypothetical protein
MDSPLLATSHLVYATLSHGLALNHLVYAALIAQGWLVIETTLFVLVYARQTYSNSCLLCASSLKE